MVPFLKGVHLTLETWRGERDEEGWKLSPKELASEEEMKEDLTEDEGHEDAQAVHLEKKEDVPPPKGPENGTTTVPRLKRDLGALIKLTKSPFPDKRIVQRNVVLTAYYGFGDASSGGFGASIERPDGIIGRFGIWGKDLDGASSNY